MFVGDVAELEPKGEAALWRKGLLEASSPGDRSVEEADCILVYVATSCMRQLAAPESAQWAAKGEHLTQRLAVKSG